MPEGVTMLEIAPNLEFRTGKGNSYVYDDILGISFPSSLFSDPAYQKKLEKIRMKQDKNIEMKAPKPEEVREYNFRNGFLQLTLCLTEDCNFRCKYCVYSENYECVRGYSHRYMSVETAKKAIDSYFSLLENGKRYNPWRNDISIGFYGGEPLLNFKVLRASVEYVKEKYPEWNVSYTITTNTTLLDKEKADFPMENDFSIAVSLDGPKEEHDRNRVYIDGRGTFDDVIKNVRYIMEKGYEKIHSLAVFDWKSDIFKLDEFFRRDDVPVLSNISLVNTAMGCNYYKQFTKEDFENYRRQIERGWECYLERIAEMEKGYISAEKNKPSFFGHFFGLGCSKSVFQAVAVIPANPIRPFTGACIPGRKIYVDVDGKFHTCERVNDAFPIGDVEQGLDYESISRMMKSYFDGLDICKNCSIKRMCPNCYSVFATNDGFLKASQVCKNRELSVARSLGDAFALGEISPDILESVAGDFYTLLKKLSFRED
jgi:uncharacterized protein